MSIGLKPTYIVVDPATQRGKYTVCRLQIGGSYLPYAECRSKGVAQEIVNVLENQAFNERWAASYKQAAE